MAAEQPATGSKRYSKIGRYDVVSHIATGGICAVYKAVDRELGRDVALKIMPPEMATRPAMFERFRREARHCARLDHPNIVKIYEFGETHGTHFLALEFIAGADLFDHITEKGKLDPEEACPLLIQAATALDELHRHHLIHRDIKPSNFLLTRKDDKPLLKLTDMGLARLTRDDEFRVTRDGSTVGTVDYMSPEQARDSSAADIRSDIYSLGCTAYHMLAGRPPFDEGGLTERILNHLEVEPPDIRDFNPKVSRDLQRILRKMLAKKPHDRYQTPAELLRDLTTVRLTPEPKKSKEGSLPPRGKPKRSKPGSETVHGLQSKHTTPEVDPSSIDIDPSLRPTAEQAQAAETLKQRAQDALISRNIDYAIELLLGCCKLDPSNLNYRRALRKAVGAKYEDAPRGKISAFFSTAGIKRKMRAALSAKEYRRVLEIGEEILAQNPGDMRTQMDMSAAADELGLLDLAVWILRQAFDKNAPDLVVGRELARLYEKRGEFGRAIKTWEIIRRADPNDIEASRKARDLSASETIARVKKGKHPEEEDDEDD